MNPKDVRILFLEPATMSPYLQKGLGRCDEVKDLEMGRYSGSSRWPSVISRSFQEGGRRARVRGDVRTEAGSTGWAIAMP